MDQAPARRVEIGTHRTVRPGQGGPRAQKADTGGAIRGTEYLSVPKEPDSNKMPIVCKRNQGQCVSLCCADCHTTVRTAASTENTTLYVAAATLNCPYATILGLIKLPVLPRRSIGEDEASPLQDTLAT